MVSDCCQLISFVLSAYASDVLHLPVAHLLRLHNLPCSASWAVCYCYADSDTVGHLCSVIAHRSKGRHTLPAQGEIAYTLFNEQTFKIELALLLTQVWQC